MDLQHVIDQLAVATGSDRRLDGEIAQIVGFRRRVEEFRDGSTGEVRTRVLWVVPTGEAAPRVPHYTRDIVDAVELAREEFPGHVGGCSWEPGRASARIDDGPYFQAASVPLALCMAVLHKKIALSAESQR